MEGGDGKDNVEQEGMLKGESGQLDSFVIRTVMRQ